MNGNRFFGPGISRLAPGSALSTDHLPRTALLVSRGVPRHLEAHLHRLEAGAAALGQAVDWLMGLGTDLAAWLASGHPPDVAALRLVLHPEAGLLSARLEPPPAAPQPCRLVLLPHPMTARQLDPTIRHKGLAGPWGRDILAQVSRLGAHDALLHWPDGTLAETAMAAVGIEVGNHLLVPPVEGRVTSLTERLDLPEWAQSHGLRIATTELTFALAAEGRVWCMNALRGFWPATLLRDH